MNRISSKINNIQLFLNNPPKDNYYMFALVE